MGNIDRASHLALPFIDWLSSEAEHASTRPPVVVVEIVEADSHPGLPGSGGDREGSRFARQSFRPQPSRVGGSGT